MDAHIVYDASGNVVSVTIPEPEHGAHIEAIAGDGESVLSVDASAIGGSEHADGSAALTLVTDHCVDAANGQLSRK